VSNAASPSNPPVDPRGTWSLPAFGSMDVVTDLDEVVTRVLAPNPSPMTLDGTNTYVVGVAGSGEALVVDPGPDDEGHLAAVQAVLARKDAAVRAVVVTHHHLDHAEAAVAWARVFGAPVMAADLGVARPADAPADHRGDTLVDGQLLSLTGVDVEVVATPGHTRDHLSLRLGTGALLTGDHVLGRGTSVVAHPDGDLEAYLRSLARVLALGPDVLYPGHGPALREDPGAVLRFYAAHRAYREEQVLAALDGRRATPRQLVEEIYAEVDRRVLPAAEASTRATLTLLLRRGRIRWDADDRVSLPGSA
jgi:glyoxylase-like metal-dependent hydrolase (beta-lactamase superfamily II)